MIIIIICTVARDKTWILPSFNEVNCIPKRFSGFANDVMNLKIIKTSFFLKK